MSPKEPDVAVVVSTFNRADRLRDLLAGLRSQTHPAGRFEVVVVDNGCSDGTGSVLAQEAERGELRLRPLRLDVNAGRAVARDRGWRAARARIVAFTDDDCVPSPDWLAAGLRACAANPGAIVQGRTDPIPGERERFGYFARAFTRTVEIGELDAAYQTCNVFYPRELLERIDGFDADAYTGVPGEDADLAWRAIGAGATGVFAPEVRVHHAVNQLGPLGKLRLAASWDMKVYARHPEVRRAHFARGIFWKGTHWRLVRALCALLLPRRLRLAGLWLAYPYLKTLWARGKLEGGGPLLAPYYLLYDLVELVTVVRSAIRYRTPML